jgi:hypothetical protein
MAVDLPRTAGCSLSLICQWDSKPLTKKSRLIKKFIRFSCLLWLFFDGKVWSLPELVALIDCPANPLANIEIFRISQESLLREEPFKRLSKNFFLSIYYSGLGITGLNRHDNMRKWGWWLGKTYLQAFMHYFVLLVLQHHVEIRVIHDCHILLWLAWISD